MPEGVLPYPKWIGSLATGSRAWVIAGQEVRRALRSNWVLLAAGLGLAVGAASVIEIVQARRDAASLHNVDTYLAMLRQLRWFAVAVAAAVGGPILLEDLRSGALDLYLGRPVTRGAYLVGKGAAVLALVGAVMLLPVLLYYLATLAFYDDHPDDWHALQAGGVASALLWSLVVTGLALGLSAAARSARAAALLLFGGFVGLHILTGELLSGLTEDTRWRVLSPFASMRAVDHLLLRTGGDVGFEAWWGAVAVAVLLALGWALLAWRRPRVRGEEA